MVTFDKWLLYAGHPLQAEVPPVPSHRPSPGHVPLWTTVDALVGMAGPPAFTIAGSIGISVVVWVGLSIWGWGIGWAAVRAANVVVVAFGGIAGRDGGRAAGVPWSEDGRGWRRDLRYRPVSREALLVSKTT